MKGNLPRPNRTPKNSLSKYCIKKKKKKKRKEKKKRKSSKEA